MDIKSVNYQTDTGFTLFQKNRNQANLEALAEEFESMFINQMLRLAMILRLQFLYSEKRANLIVNLLKVGLN